MVVEPLKSGILLFRCGKIRVWKSRMSVIGFQSFAPFDFSISA